MKVISTFHRPTAVSHSLKCSLVEDCGIEHLVVAKLNTIDVYLCQPTGLGHEPETVFEIWGRIIALKALPIQGSRCSNLVVMTDHPTPELMFLSYSSSNEAGSRTLMTTKNLSLSDRSARQAEYFNDVLVNPSGAIAVASCHTGKFKVIHLRDGEYESDFDLSVPELNILSIAIIASSRNSLSLAILHRDHREQICLLSRDINIVDMELSSSPSALLHSTVISAKVLPLSDALPSLAHVPSPENPQSLGGVLLFGGRRILFFQLADRESREKFRDKHRRTERGKKSADPAEVQRAKQKELERDSRKRKPKAKIEWPWSEITAWCTIDQGANPCRFLLGDSFGRLALLSFDVHQSTLILVPLGEASPPSTITYLTTQIVYLGSYLGDSQLLRIHSSRIGSIHNHAISIPPDIPVAAPSRISMSMMPDDDEIETEVSTGKVVGSTGNYITVLRTFRNIAPIVDATSANLDAKGHACMITCSGGRNTGSLRVIQDGAGFEELAVVAGISDVTNVWPIRTRFDDSFDSFIFLSTTQDSHLLQLDRANLVSRVAPTSTSLVLNLPTLALGNITWKHRNEFGRNGYDESSSLVVQITMKSLTLFDFDFTTLEHTHTGEIWAPQSLSEIPDLFIDDSTKIVAASVNSSQMLLALSGAVIVLLCLNEKGKLLLSGYHHVGERWSQGNEISAVSCIPQDGSKKYSTFISVAFWGSNHIKIFSIERIGFRFLCKTATLAHVPRSLLLRDFLCEPEHDPRTYLLAGLGNGTVASFAFRDKSLVDQKTVLLGGIPVCMTAMPYELHGRLTVFASGGKTSIFYWDRNRLLHTPVVFKDVMAASPLRHPFFAKCVIMATTSSLVIGRVGELNRLHVRSVPLGLDNPRRIVFDETHKVLGVACTRSEPVRVGDPEISRSFLRFLDYESFSELTQYNCALDEEITALQSVSLICDGHPQSYICVGTFSYRADEKEPTEGRLLLFDNMENPLGKGRQMSLIASADVQGCVYALANLDNMIAAAINAAAVIYRLERSNQHQSTSKLILKKVTEWQQNYLVRSLATYDDKLVLGDAMSSVSVLTLVESKLRLIARDYGPLWPVCILMLDKKSIMGTNADMNIFTFALREFGTQAVLEQTGRYHLADMVTKFISGALGSSSCPEIGQQQTFFTSSGCIGVVTDVSMLPTTMTAVQQSLATILEGRYGISHIKYRAPKHLKGSTNPASGFLDGDFLQRHLECPSLREHLLGRGVGDPEITENDLERMKEILQSLYY